jgi:hypothetical protein
MTTYLYIKTHRVTGLKYFGKTVHDPFVYNGSGSYWTKHLQKHGYDLDTEIYFSSDNIDEVKEVAERFSKEQNIVESNEWANLCPETGIDGGSIPGIDGLKNIIESRKSIVFSNEWREKMSKAKLGKACPETVKSKISQSMVNKPSNRLGKTNSDKHRKKISEANSGTKWWNNGEKMIRSHKSPGDGWKRGMLKSHLSV